MYRINADIDIQRFIAIINIKILELLSILGGWSVRYIKKNNNIIVSILPFDSSI